MKHTVLGMAITLSTAVGLSICSVGCGSNTPASANSFTKVYAQVIQPQCSNNFCHFNGVNIRYSGLDLSSKTRAYWSLLGVPGTGPACSQAGMRVLPWDPDHSVLYQKLLPSPPCGIQMPADSTTFSTNGTSDLKFSGNQLPPDQLQLIHDWIQEGAYDN
jgi:hypothetical protein